MYDSGRNLWRMESGLRFSQRGLIFYAPLWHPQTNSSPFNALDLVTPGVVACTVTGTTWGTQGRALDGDDYIQIGSPPTFAAGAPWTLETFVFPINGYWQSIASNNASFSPSIKLHNDGTAVFFHPADGGAQQAWTGLADWKSSWHHLVLVSNGDGTINMFWDTVDRGSKTPTTTAFTFSYLGVSDTNRFFVGTIGEVRIYNRASTALEIQHNFSSIKWRYQ